MCIWQASRAPASCSNSNGSSQTFLERLTTQNSPEQLHCKAAVHQNSNSPACRHALVSCTSSMQMAHNCPVPALASSQSVQAQLQDTPSAMRLTPP